MSEIKRQVIPCVTVFIKRNAEYLFIHRAPTKTVDPDRLNGVGGKVEHNEHFLDTAVRETREETGLIIAKSDFRMLGIGHLYRGYAVDWVCCFFTAQIESGSVIGNEFMDNEDGKLVWMTPDEFAKSPLDRTDDLSYIFDYIRREKKFFFTAVYDDNQKVTSIQIDDLLI